VNEDVMLNRRQALSGGAVGLLGGLGCACTGARPGRHDDIFGCTLPDREVPSFLDTATEPRLFITGDEPVIPRSGDKYFDLALAQTLSMISDLFEVTPGFAYFDDYDGLNAYATPKARLNGSNGTVLFGQGMLAKLRDARESPDACVAAVCAHEFGHILQFKHGLTIKLQAGQSTTKRSELQADIFAGFFAGTRRRQRSSFPAAVFALTLYNFGDNQVNKPSHHGTGDERAGAFILGHDASYRDKKSISEVIDMSTKYVMAL
jgi:hypothetical protein